MQVERVAEAHVGDGVVRRLAVGLELHGAPRRRHHVERARRSRRGRGSWRRRTRRNGSRRGAGRSHRRRPAPRAGRPGPASLPTSAAIQAAVTRAAGLLDAAGEPRESSQPRTVAPRPASTYCSQLAWTSSAASSVRSAARRCWIASSDVAVGHEPLGGAGVQGPHLVRVRELQLAARHGGEEVVETEPLALLVERDDEQVERSRSWRIARSRWRRGRGRTTRRRTGRGSRPS